MPNLAAVLKEEISRLARKELKSDIDTLRKSATHYRSEIAALKRHIAALERSVKGVAKSTVKVTETQGDGEVPKLRFRADGFKAKREALGLSADAAGKFFNVTGQTIYLWEAKRTAPRVSQLPAVAAFRKLGKKQAHAILATLA